MALPYTHWQSMRPGRPWERLSPNLGALRDELLSLGGQSLTGDAVNPRPVTGGTAPSSHWFGAALDWRYENVGGGRVEIPRRQLDRDVIPWLIEHHERLGVQMIIDYLKSRTWKCDRRAWRASSGSHHGQSWAQYLHIETNADMWGNGQPIRSRGVPALAAGNLPEPNPPFPLPGGDTVYNLTVRYSTLRRGSTGPAVRGLQASLNHLTGSRLVTDGQFGPATEVIVRNYQSFTKLTVDGIVGPQTATSIATAMLGVR